MSSRSSSRSSIGSSSMNNHSETRRRRPKVLCLGVSFPCMKQSAEQAGVPWPPAAAAAPDDDAPLLQVTSSPEAEEEQDAVNGDAIGDDGESSIATTETRRMASPQKRRTLPTTNDDHHNEDATTSTSTIRKITQTVQECVQNGILTQMDGRDLVRCLATEQCCGVDVYTVSQECGAAYRADRHLHANFNRSVFVSKLIKHFQQSSEESSAAAAAAAAPTIVLFDQIVLDYFWIPHGWDAQHWPRAFFAKRLVDLSKVLRQGDDGEGGGVGGGVIYLPFCCHVFQQVLSSQDALLRHYNISFVRKGDNEPMNQVYLWKGTQQINSKTMQQVFGKRLDQEEVYCSFGPRNVAEAMVDAAISKKELRETCLQLEDFHDIRFIALRRIPAVDAIDSECDSAASPSSSSSIPEGEAVTTPAAQVQVSAASPIVVLPSPSSSTAPAQQQTPIPVFGKQPGQVRSRTLPLRSCRRRSLEPDATPRKPAAKRSLFSNQRNTKIKRANRGRILGLQDPRTVQRGFYSTPTATTTTAATAGGTPMVSNHNRSSVAASQTTATRVVTPSLQDNNHDDSDKKRKRSPQPEDEEEDHKPTALFMKTEK